MGESKEGDLSEVIHHLNLVVTESKKPAKFAFEECEDNTVFDQSVSNVYTKLLKDFSVLPCVVRLEKWQPSKLLLTKNGAVIVLYGSNRHNTASVYVPKPPPLKKVLGQGGNCPDIRSSVDDVIEYIISKYCHTNKDKFGPGDTVISPIENALTPSSVEQCRMVNDDNKGESAFTDIGNEGFAGFDSNQAPENISSEIEETESAVEERVAVAETVDSNDLVSEETSQGLRSETASALEISSVNVETPVVPPVAVLDPQSSLSQDLMFDNLVTPSEEIKTEPKDVEKDLKEDSSIAVKEPTKDSTPILIGSNCSKESAIGYNRKANLLASHGIDSVNLAMTSAAGLSAANKTNPKRCLCCPDYITQCTSKLINYMMNCKVRLERLSEATILEHCRPKDENVSPLKSLEKELSSSSDDEIDRRIYRQKKKELINNKLLRKEEKLKIMSKKLKKETQEESPADDQRKIQVEAALNQVYGSSAPQFKSFRIPKDQKPKKEVIKEKELSKEELVFGSSSDRPSEIEKEQLGNEVPSTNTKEHTRSKSPNTTKSVPVNVVVPFRKEDPKKSRHSEKKSEREITHERKKDREHDVDRREERVREISQEKKKERDKELCRDMSKERDERRKREKESSKKTEDLSKFNSSRKEDNRKPDESDKYRGYTDYQDRKDVRKGINYKGKDDFPTCNSDPRKDPRLRFDPELARKQEIAQRRSRFEQLHAKQSPEKKKGGDTEPSKEKKPRPTVLEGDGHHEDFDPEYLDRKLCEHFGIPYEEPKEPTAYEDTIATVDMDIDSPSVESRPVLLEAHPAAALLATPLHIPGTNPEAPFVPGLALESDFVERVVYIRPSMVEVQGDTNYVNHFERRSVPLLPTPEPVYEKSNGVPIPEPVSEKSHGVPAGADQQQENRGTKRRVLLLDPSVVLEDKEIVPSNQGVESKPRILDTSRLVEKEETVPVKKPALMNPVAPDPPVVVSSMELAAIRNSVLPDNASWSSDETPKKEAVVPKPVPPPSNVPIFVESQITGPQQKLIKMLNFNRRLPGDLENINTSEDMGFISEKCATWITNLVPSPDGQEAHDPEAMDEILKAEWRKADDGEMSVMSSALSISASRIGMRESDQQQESDPSSKESNQAQEGSDVNINPYTSFFVNRGGSRVSASKSESKEDEAKFKTAQQKLALLRTQEAAESSEDEEGAENAEAFFSMLDNFGEKEQKVKQKPSSAVQKREPEQPVQNVGVTAEQYAAMLKTYYAQLQLAGYQYPYGTAATIGQSYMYPPLPATPAPVPPPSKQQPPLPATPAPAAVPPSSKHLPPLPVTPALAAAPPLLKTTVAVPRLLTLPPPPPPPEEETGWE